MPACSFGTVLRSHDACGVVVAFHPAIAEQVARDADLLQTMGECARAGAHSCVRRDRGSFYSSLIAKNFYVRNNGSRQPCNSSADFAMAKGKYRCQQNSTHGSSHCRCSPYYEGPRMIDLAIDRRLSNFVSRDSVRECWDDAHAPSDDDAPVRWQRMSACYASHVTDYLSEDAAKRDLPARHISRNSRSGLRQSLRQSMAREAIRPTDRSWSSSCKAARRSA
jgi:hypothetical protein